VVESKEYDLSIDTLYSFNLSSLSGYYGYSTVVANKPDDKRHVDAPVKPVYICNKLPGLPVITRALVDGCLPAAGAESLAPDGVEAAAWSQ